jgi:hypothetical protein
LRRPVACGFAFTDMFHSLAARSMLNMNETKTHLVLPLRTERPYTNNSPSEHVCSSTSVQAVRVKDRPRQN